MLMEGKGKKMTTTQIPGYDRDVVTMEDLHAFRKDAERRGHVYELFIDGDPPTKKGEGIIFGAKTENEAKISAYRRAWRISIDIDDFDIVDGPQYPTHGYKLYHQGRLVVNYIPPNPEDVASGKVVMPMKRDVMDGRVPPPH